MKHGDELLWPPSPGDDEILATKTQRFFLFLPSCLRAFVANFMVARKASILNWMQGPETYLNMKEMKYY